MSSISILGTSCLEIYPNPVLQNTPEIIPKKNITGIIPVKFQQRQSGDDQWTYPYNTITKIRFFIKYGNSIKSVDVELQTVSNQPGWNGGTLANLQQAQSDVNAWLVSGGSLTPSATLFASISNIALAPYTVGSGPSAASSAFNVFGAMLSPAAENVTITPSSHLEISDDSGTTWQSTPIVVGYTGSSLHTASIYKVRLKAGLATNSYNETVTVTGGTATPYVISVTASVSFNNAFIMTVETDNAGITPSNSFLLPLNTSYTYNSVIDWGDGTTTNQTTNTSPTHVYATPGSYQIKISGTFGAIFFNGSGDRLKLTSIDNWGTTQWQTLNSAFSGCSNMVGNFSDVPNLSLVTAANSTFTDCHLFNTDISAWDVSNITRMDSMFSGCTAFNQNIGSWNTVNVTNMFHMFKDCPAFNQNLNSWNVTNVTSMQRMFSGCTIFNQPLGGWITSSVTDISYMFENCSAFNKNISSWDVSNVTTVEGTFFYTTNYNQPLNTWNVGNVTSMFLTFIGCANFNQALGSWNTVHVTNMQQIFYSCVSFNQPLNTWNTSSVQTLYLAFFGCTSFNQDLHSWNTASVTDMRAVFQNCSAFNGNVTTWITTGAPSLLSTFEGCSVFNQDVSAWDVSNVTDLTQTFFNCSAFNKNINAWNISNVTSMFLTFANCSAFNQPLNGWNTANVTNMQEALQGCTVFNQPLNNWNTSKVTNMSYLFYICPAFNQFIGNWDTSLVATMASMFVSCTAFDQDISNWNVSNVSDLSNFMLHKSAADYSTTHLNSIYNKWSLLTLQHNVVANFDSIKYTSTGTAGRAVLTGAPNNWTITDGGI